MSLDLSSNFETYSQSDVQEYVAQLLSSFAQEVNASSFEALKRAVDEKFNNDFIVDLFNSELPALSPVMLPTVNGITAFSIVDYAMSLGLPENKKYIMQSMAANIADYVNSPGCHGEVKRSMLVLNTKVAVNLINLIGGFVAIQPMHGPVGRIFALTVSDVTDRKSDLQIESHVVEARTRALGVSMRGYLEDEMIHSLAQEITHDIVKNIMLELRKWTKVIGEFETSNPMGEINTASWELAKVNRRGGANFITCDTQSKIRINDISGGNLIFDGKGQPVHYMGKLQSYDVYCDNTSNDNSITIGYKSTITETDCSLIYSPYMLCRYSSVMNPITFEPHMTFTTRHATLGVI